MSHDPSMKNTRGIGPRVGGLQYMNGSIIIRKGWTDEPAVVTASFPDLVYANNIRVGSVNALSFPNLISVAVRTAYTDGGIVSLDYPYLVANSPAGFSFPALQIVNGSSPGSSTYPATTPNAFPALTTILGNVGGGPVLNMYPALKNISGDLNYHNMSLNWMPELEFVGGDMSIVVYGDFNVSNLPPKLTNVTGKLSSSVQPEAPPTTNLTIPSIQSVGSIESYLGRMPPGSTVSFPNLTTVTGYRHGCSILFRDSDNVTTLRMDSLEYLAPNCFFDFGATADTTGLLPQKATVYVPCVAGVSSILQHNRQIDWNVHCPTGCNLCIPPPTNPPGGGAGGGGGGGVPPPPSAVPVTTVALNNAVAACFTENAAGNCQCSGAGCGPLRGHISTWSFTGTNLDMGSLFEGRTTFNQPIGSWDVRGVTSMNRMFKNASSFNQPIGSWNTASVTDMTQMFAGATSFARDISRWDVDQVQNSNLMFDGADAFNAKYTCDGPKCSGDPKLGLTDAQIAGIAVGCIAFVIILIIVVCVRRRRRARDELRARLGLSPAGVPQASAPPPQIIIVQQ